RDEIDSGVGERPKQMMQADRTMHDRLVEAIQDDLVAALQRDIGAYGAIAPGLPDNYRVGDIEDANVLVQNSLWLSVPIGSLDKHDQVVSLQDRRKWASNQLAQIALLRTKFDEMAANVAAV